RGRGLPVRLVHGRDLRVARVKPLCVRLPGLRGGPLEHLGAVHGLRCVGAPVLVRAAPTVGLDLSAALGGGRRLLLLEALVLCRGLLERLLRLLRGRRGATTAAVLVGEDLGGCDEGPGDGAVDDGVEALCELGRVVRPDNKPRCVEPGAGLEGCHQGGRIVRHFSSLSQDIAGTPCSGDGCRHTGWGIRRCYLGSTRAHACSGSFACLDAPRRAAVDPCAPCPPHYPRGSRPPNAGGCSMAGCRKPHAAPPRGPPPSTGSRRPCALVPSSGVRCQSGHTLPSP